MSVATHPTNQSKDSRSSKLEVSEYYFEMLRMKEEDDIMKRLGTDEATRSIAERVYSQ